MPGLVYGYEEAIGYCTDPRAVPDKDGISALARLLRLAAGLKADGGSISDRLDEIACQYGVYETDQMSIRVKHVEIIAEAMARLRASPPTMLAGQSTSMVDLAQGSDALPPTDAVLINGETVKVVIALKDGFKDRVTEDEIIEWARQNMAAYKVPRYVAFIDSLPRSGTGKIQWRALQEQENAQ